MIIDYPPVYSQRINSDFAQLVQNSSQSVKNASLLGINGTLIDNINPRNNSSFKLKKISSDSSESVNTITVWENSTSDVVMTLKMKEKDQKIKISVWNMLGKKVIDDYDGPFLNLEEKHIIKSSNLLTRGVYLIRVQGEKSRLDSKFVISR